MPKISNFTDLLENWNQLFLGFTKTKNSQHFLGVSPLLSELVLLAIL